LKRFLAPQLAELIVSQGDEKILESHRREIVVVFCDLRGYTAFTETAEPEEVLDFLREYHGALGPLVSQYEGTLDQFSGDGIMVFFNDPVPCPDPAERAVKMAMAMREAGRHADCRLARAWSRFRFWRWYRARLCDAGPDRVLRALRLYGDRHGVQRRRSSLC
jgi:class 3 adenylate cyclase